MKRLGICFAASVLAACSAPMMMASDVATGDSAMRAMDAQSDVSMLDGGGVDVPSGIDVQGDISVADVPNRDVVTVDRPTVDSGATCGAYTQING